MAPYDYWAKLEIKLPFYFLVDDNSTFTVKVADYDCLLKLRESKEPFMRAPGVGQEKNVELARDRYGLLRASDALVHVPGPLLNIEPDSIESQASSGAQNEFKALDKALEVINRFIEVYRILSGEFHIKRLLDSDLTGFWTVNIHWFKSGRYESVAQTPVGVVACA